jgi:AcrR family transcriptional regulator
MDVKPRKLPRQARARVTIDAIVEASTQLLLERGYDRFTTARAAERAGVSVGSLYQYFPNKAALAAAVIDRACEAFLLALDQALAGRPRITLAECIRAIVDVTLVSHQLAPDLHRIVIDLAPRIGVADRTDRVSRKMAEAIEAILRMHADEIAPGIDLATAATIIETLLVALAHRAALAAPATARDDVIAGETTEMITRYLAVDR